MEKDWLAAELAAGRSIESIARDVGKDPRTVGYWVHKHSLVSRHAAKHASRGGIPRETLEGLVERGLPVRAMADELGVSFSTVRHWLGRYGLTTGRAQRRAPCQGRWSIHPHPRRHSASAPATA
jgi:IS30 family transposase